MTSHRALVVELGGASRHFHTDAETVRAVDDVSFTARTGEFICLYGASGSGKSTLLNLIAGLDRPDSGDIRVGGIEVSGAGRDALAHLRLTTIGVVFQQDNLIEEFTVAENIAFPLELQGGTGRADVDAEVRTWLDRVGMSGYDDRFPRELSGGQQQRVGIARALVGDRQVLVADEPTGALDSVNSENLFELLHDLSRAGQTIILSSHDTSARSWASRVVEMVDGRLIDG